MNHHPACIFDQHPQMTHCVICDCIRHGIREETKACINTAHNILNKRGATRSAVLNALIDRLNETEPTT